MKEFSNEAMRKEFMLKVYKMIVDFMTEFSPFGMQNCQNLPMNISYGASSIFQKNLDYPMGMTFEARAFFQFLLNLTFLLNDFNEEMLSSLKPNMVESGNQEEKSSKDNSNENLQGKISFKLFFLRGEYSPE